MTFLCKFCQSVWLHWFKLPDGKVIPVDESGNHHLDICPKAPNARATAVSKQQIQKIDDHDRIGGVFGYIESLNERLVNFRLELKVISLQKNLNLEGNN